MGGRQTITQEKRQIELYASGEQLCVDTAGAGWFMMTPVEARRFAAALLKMADELTEKAA